MKIPRNIKLNFFTGKPEYESKISCGFYSGLKISVSVGLLGAVGVFLATRAKHFIEFNHFGRDGVSPRSWAVPGLENLGNNCFLNVVLQALASCSSFRKYLREMEEEYGLLSGEGDENIPLIISLTSLLEDLCIVKNKRTVLSPGNLMLAVDHYIPHFNLMRQQDAEEAFSHLLSSLREEIEQYCVPTKSCLADLPALRNGRIVAKGTNEEESELDRWNRCFLKPFDGILGSILVCRSCTFQISLDFQLFHSLHLSPPAGSDAIKAGCTLDDCLKHFFVAEHIESYCCTNCWHKAAVEYASAFSKDERDIEILQRCNKSDSCDCKALSSLEAFIWSNRFSHAFKQLSISRSPKILAIHLQRASYNIFGEPVKLLGHIHFPMILDFSPFINTRVGITNTDSSLRYWPSTQSSSKETWRLPYPRHPNMLIDPNKMSSKSIPVTDFSIKETVEEQTAAVENGSCFKASDTAPSLSDSRNSPSSKLVALTTPSLPAKHQTYRLVSVVEHFGTSGGGHYTVYRKVTARLGEEDSVALLESAVEQWFCISDANVYAVSEKDVLGANASMLFYEKIDFC